MTMRRRSLSCSEGRLIERLATISCRRRMAFSAMSSDFERVASRATPDKVVAVSGARSFLMTVQTALMQRTATDFTADLISLCTFSSLGLEDEHDAELRPALAVLLERDACNRDVRRPRNHSRMTKVATTTVQGAEGAPCC